MFSTSYTDPYTSTGCMSSYPSTPPSHEFFQKRLGSAGSPGLGEHPPHPRSARGRERYISKTSTNASRVDTVWTWFRSEGVDYITPHRMRSSLTHLGRPSPLFSRSLGIIALRGSRRGFLRGPVHCSSTKYHPRPMPRIMSFAKMVPPAPTG